MSTKKSSKKPAVKKIPATVENLPLIRDISRAVGIIAAVRDTTKGERRATVLDEAIELLSKTV